MEVQSIEKIDLKKRQKGLLEHLQGVLKDYLTSRSHMSLNSLSKKCTVSEPTLRRIAKGQVKTLPNVTTVLDILTYISGERNTYSIAKKYGGAIEEFITQMLPHAMDRQTDYDVSLNSELKNSTKYLIYKLASNDLGVKHQKIIELFGSQGLMFVDELLKKSYLTKKEDTYFSSTESFTSSHENFVDNFKTVSNFIKTHKEVSRTLLNPLFSNYSNSVSPEAYKEIVSLQRRTLKKVRDILSDEKSAGSIPIFHLLAVDTLDTKTAYELDKEE